jgi:hypothetical protein
MRWAAPVIQAAMGEKQYSPGSSGAATLVVKGTPVGPYAVTVSLRD